MAAAGASTPAGGSAHASCSGSDLPPRHSSIRYGIPLSSQQGTAKRGGIPSNIRWSGRRLDPRIPHMRCAQNERSCGDDPEHGHAEGSFTHCKHECLPPSVSLIDACGHRAGCLCIVPPQLLLGALGVGCYPSPCVAWTGAVRGCRRRPCVSTLVQHWISSSLALRIQRHLQVAPLYAITACLGPIGVDGRGLHRRRAVQAVAVRGRRRPHPPPLRHSGAQISVAPCRRARPPADLLTLSALSCNSPYLPLLRSLSRPCASSTHGCLLWPVRCLLHGLWPLRSMTSSHFGAFWTLIAGGDGYGDALASLCPSRQTPKAYSTRERARQQRATGWKAQG